MSIPYESLKMWQLLCIADAYNAINECGKNIVPNWDIDAFEKSVFFEEFYDYSITAEQAVLLKEACKPLSEKKPLLNYSDDGLHYGFELFLDPVEEDDCGGKLLFAEVSRVLSEYVLPMDEQIIRECINTVARTFIPKSKALNKGMHRNNSLWFIDCIDEMTVRALRKEILNRNRAYVKRQEYGVYPKPLYLDKAVKAITEYCNGSEKTQYYVKKDLGFDDIIRSMEYKSTRKQIDNAFLLWGVYTGKPLSYSEVGRKCNISPNAVRTSVGRVLSYITRQMIVFDLDHPKQKEENQDE